MCMGTGIADDVNWHTNDLTRTLLSILPGSVGRRATTLGTASLP